MSVRWLVAVLLVASMYAFGLGSGPSYVQAQGPALYVADPGKSFGPIRVGLVVPRYHVGPLRFGGDLPSVPGEWTIACTDTYRDGNAPPRLLSAAYYYMEYGLLVRVEYLFAPSEATSVETIKPGTLWDSERPAAHLVMTQCVTPKGHPVPFATRLTRPPGAKYITTKNIGIGATLREVVAAHGAVAMIYRSDPTKEQVKALGTDAPVRVDLNRLDPTTVHQLGYCGITFTFLAGRVDNIAVDAYKGTPCSHL